MSLSIPTTRTPSLANRLTDSDPISPAEPVTIIVRILRSVIRVPRIGYQLFVIGYSDSSRDHRQRRGFSVNCYQLMVNGDAAQPQVIGFLTSDF
jgi:hypothetical protein